MKPTRLNLHIEKVRVVRKKSHDDVSKRSGIPLLEVISYEKGVEPSTEKLQTICHVLDVEYDLFVWTLLEDPQTESELEEMLKAA